MKRLLCALSLALAPAAWADIPPPNSIGCRDKALGEACERDDKTAGACAKATCTRNDYSEGPPPKSVSYECLKCEAAAAPAPAPAAAEKKSSCAAVPGEGVVALLAVLAARRRAR